MNEEVPPTAFQLQRVQIGLSSRNL